MAKNINNKQASSGSTRFTDLEIKRGKIDDLLIDGRNANKGTDLGKELLQTSVSKYGAGRGVLIGRNGRLIAGNHTVPELKRQGIVDIIIVPTDGKTLVVTQRIDIEENSKEGYEMALADNRVGQANLNFDVDIIRDLKTDFDLDLADLAININDDGPYFPGNEQETDSADQMETSYNPSNVKGTGPTEEKQQQYEQSYFPLAIALSKAERLAFDAWKKEKKIQTDTEAFQLMFKLVK